MELHAPGAGADAKRVVGLKRIARQQHRARCQLPHRLPVRGLGIKGVGQGAQQRVAVANPQQWRLQRHGLLQPGHQGFAPGFTVARHGV
ncbi:MAG: hypothetical protein U1D25_17060 [Hydrogenophaga sp.]|uniref:hypothetical protein n=1 Tax=Hydrogenophaga sp. TaxID=1904254 RepID=UPI00276216E3|nr:hypothetical protein [Hydrogenophaga sp.]MDP2416520.1 hypothetical protein [Hydrogenophaga sp.]MDZ4189794.1 hypothetical protein [Hydrogenophaga sp.]